MTEVTKNEVKEKIENKLKEWVDPEQVGYGEILSLNYSNDGQSAYALVKYPDTIEIDYLFYSIFSKEASLSCDKRFQLFEEEYDAQAGDKNQLVIDSVTEAYQTFIRRFD